MRSARIADQELHFSGRDEIPKARITDRWLKVSSRCGRRIPTRLGATPAKNEFAVVPPLQSRDERQTQAPLCSPRRRAPAPSDARFPPLGDLRLIPRAVASGLFSNAPAGRPLGGIKQQIGNQRAAEANAAARSSAVNHPNQFLTPAVPQGLRQSLRYRHIFGDVSAADWTLPVIFPANLRGGSDSGRCRRTWKGVSFLSPASARTKKKKKNPQDERSRSHE